MERIITLLEKSLYLLLLIIFEISGINAQQDRPICGTPTLQDIQITNPEMYKAIMDNALNNEQSKYQKSNGDIITIPVVVHVIYGDALGLENISDEQIYSQIKALNEDYGKISGTSGDGNGVNMKIQFCLASKAPNGKYTTGITRKKSNLTVHNKSTQEASLKALIQWPPDRYLNVWVVKSITNSSGIFVLGYSSFPEGSESLDGIVMRYGAFGRTGYLLPDNNLGKSFSHEVGHWLGLFHTFQNGCDAIQITALNCANTGDLICDTPVDTIQYDNCVDKNTCDNEDGDPHDLVHNYMTYYCDSCLNEFTQGQKDKVYSYLNNPTSRRNTIFQVDNLVKAGCHCVETTEDVTEEWNKLHKVGGIGDYARCMTTDRNNYVYIGGYEIVDGVNDDYRVNRYTSDGSTFKTYRYDNPDYHSVDVVTAMHVDDAGSVYVTGQTMTNDGFEDIYTIKLNGFQYIEWTEIFDGIDQNEDYPSVIKTDVNDNVYVAGFTNYENRSEYLLMKYSAFGGMVIGQPLWIATHGGSDSLADHINDMVIDPAGNIYVTGYTQDTGQKLNITTIKYNPIGNSVWIAKYDDINSESQTAYSVQLDDSNNVYIAGRTDIDPTDGSFDYKGLVLKYNQNGTLLWEYIDPTVNYARSLKIDEDNDVIVGGDNTLTSSADLTVIKLSSEGSLLWRDTINGSADYGDFFKALDVDCDNNIYVVGKTTGNSNLGNGFLTTKINSVGNVLWRKYFYGTDNGEEIPVGIDVTSRGDVYVGGSSYVSNENTYKFAVVKYNQGTFNSIAGEEELEYVSENNEILVFPNPANDIVNIRCLFDNEHSGIISIYDITGKLIEEFTFQNQNKLDSQIDVKNYTRGIYLIKIQMDESVLLKKIVVGD